MAFRDLGIAHLKSKASPPAAAWNEIGRGGIQPGHQSPDTRKRVWRAVQRVTERVAWEVVDTSGNLLMVAVVLVLLYALGVR